RHARTGLWSLWPMSTSLQLESHANSSSLADAFRSQGRIHETPRVRPGASVRWSDAHKHLPQQSLELEPNCLAILPATERSRAWPSRPTGCRRAQPARPTLVACLRPRSTTPGNSETRIAYVPVRARQGATVLKT